jgi:hypothetical protein
MKVAPAEFSTINGRQRVQWHVQLEGAGHRFPYSDSSETTLWIDWPEAYHDAKNINGDPALAMLLPIAMRLGENISFSDRISSELLINALEVMAVYEFYFPGYAIPVEIEAQSEILSVKPSGKTGSFYSGGVDSLFNIVEMERLNKLHNTPLVNDLWVVRGMDIDIDDQELWDRVYSRLQYIRNIKPELRVIDVHTNVRRLHHGIVGWEQMGFAPILAGISKCFSDVVDAVLIGSYGRHEEIIPHASTPLVDPLWGCNRQRIRHFTCRANRQGKINTIGNECPELLSELRVCWTNPKGSYNCGKCEKCLRTQLQLKVAGLLDECKSFDEPLSLENLRKIWLPFEKKNAYAWKFWSDIAASCRDIGNPEYADVIEKKVRRAKLLSKIPLDGRLRPAAKWANKKLKIKV